MWNYEKNVKIYNYEVMKNGKIKNVKYENTFDKYEH